VTEVSPVLQALYRGDHDGVEALKPPPGELDLYEAAALGESDRVRDLLDAEPGAVSALSPDGFSPLHLAAFFGWEEVVALLLERGAPLDAHSQSSFARVTPLGSAAAAGETSIARRLLDAGADVNARSLDGEFTPLHAAAQGGNAPLVALLLERGADRSASTDEGKTSQDLAASDEIHALLGSY
jgi:ankyrin repeat protein